jgi:signal transduction histidine kinase
MSMGHQGPVAGRQGARTIEPMRTGNGTPATLSVAMATPSPEDEQARGTGTSTRIDRVRAWLRHPLRGTLATRFLVTNLIVLGVGGVILGTWVGDQLERGIVERTASITALYVESFIEPQIAVLASTGELPAEQVRQLDALLAGSSFGDRIVSLRIWSPDGTVVYSPDAALIGRSFPIEGGLADALASGDVVAKLSDLENEENVAERGRFDHLLEMYVPIRERGTGRIVATAEFYQLPTVLDEEVATARLQTWLLVGAAVLASYLLLYGIVRRASQTIERQRVVLQGQVGELSTLLAQNTALHARVRTAAERTTTLNERALRRIGADLHDGPAQMVSLALLRLDEPHTAADPAVREALQDALREMREIARGLRLPELADMPVADAASRAVGDHRRRTGAEVLEHIGSLPASVPLPVRIALYRALQELLSNATRHGSGVIDVTIASGADVIRLDVADDGQGFDIDRIDRIDPGADTAHLGLAGIREQAELLGGGFAVGTTPQGHTLVSAWWPVPGDDATATAGA